jgi:DNA-binding beta-propeller fold protein YncE
MIKLLGKITLLPSRTLFVWFAFILVLLNTGVLFGAPTELASGLGAAVGIALDRPNNQLYFVEYATGTLKRMQLTPACETTPPCSIALVASGFTHPEDVALDTDHGIAYVTTRDDPGTTGKLWRVNLATGTGSVVTFNLGAPQQIALDLPTNSAYVVGYDNGKLWRIELTTGVKVAVIKGLGHPVGLEIKADRTRAYVTEQDTNRVSEIDLALGIRVRDVATGLTAPFFLRWTDPADISLFLVERDPLNQLARIDLPTTTLFAVATGLPFRPSGVAADYVGGAAYVTTDSKLLRIPLASLALGEPVFLGVGNVPSTSIKDGYATTDPGYFLQVKDAPFGGTLNIFGNLSNFVSLGATYYRVLVVPPAGQSTVLARSWDAYRWNPATGQYDLVTITPEPGGYYQIPPEYPTFAYRWYPPFLMMQWPSADNGLYTLSVEIYNKTGPSTFAPLTSSLPAAKNSLTLLVDNSLQSVDLVAIRQHGPGPIIAPCDIVSASPNSYDFEITAYDPNHHLLEYWLTAYWGKDKSEYIKTDGTHDVIDYSQHVDAEGPHLWSGVSNQWVPSTGWSAHCDCAHTFILGSWKRTINGYYYILYNESHQSITINNTGCKNCATCGP